MEAPTQFTGATRKGLFFNKIQFSDHHYLTEFVDKKVLYKS